MDVEPLAKFLLDRSRAQVTKQAELHSGFVSSRRRVPQEDSARVGETLSVSEVETCW